MKTDVIKITSFYPLQNLLRVTQEFYEERAVVKVKSLTYEREFEIDYMTLGEISDKYHVNENQIGFGFSLLAIITFILIFFYNNIHENLILLRITQMLYAGGVVIFALGFIKGWQINLSDKKGNILTSIKQTNKNAGLISQALELITNKNGEVREITAADPFPDQPHVFEHVEYDMGDFSKTINRFYEDRLITFYQTLLKEVVYTVPYSQLSGKVFRGKVSAIPWFSYFCNFLYVGIIIIGLDLVFNIGIGINIFTFYKVGLIVFFIFFLLRYVKHEIVGFYDHDENIVFASIVNGKNKVDLERIIHFIGMKTASQTPG